VVGPIALALEQERRVSEQINALAATAREEGDYTSEQFMQWFIREQIEEVATMSNLLRVADRAGADTAAIEDFIAREHQDPGGQDPTAPRAAGSG
jgi:ferritin